MIDSPLFLDELLKKATEKSNSKVLEKLKDEKFIKSLNEVNEVLGDLGFKLTTSSDKESNKQKDVNFKISNALIKNFFTVYYVNVSSGVYFGYSSNNSYKTLKIEENGTDFFSDVAKNIPNSIYPEDQDLMRKTINKDFMLKSTKERNLFKVNYRLMLNNVPTHVTLTMMRISKDDVIIGISNNEESTKKELQYQNTLKENLTYTNIALALARNYFAVYYVDMSNDDYEQYEVNSQSQKIEKIDEGKNFFDVSIVNAKKFIYKEDLDKFLYVLKKENLVKALKTSNSISIVYRQLINGVPTYVSLKIIDLANDTNHIVFAVKNIDEQKRKESEFIDILEKERRLARTDGLTCTYNRNFFVEVEEDLNHKIANGTVKEFAVAICDINDLKRINDTYGHAAGDKFIVDAKNILLETFKESLLFRVGGDEFAIILSGNDFKNRKELVNKIAEINIKNKQENKVVIACGCSEFNVDTDKELDQVLRRADVLMYENKKQLKQ